MASWQYTQGLHDLGNGVWAYLQPNGGWGWSNAGLIVDGDESLLIDTLYDLKLTTRMLDEMRRATKAAERIDAVVNTHANGDHCYGNALVKDARIIATRQTAEEMAILPPEVMAALMSQAPQMGGLGEYALSIFGDFEFSGIPLTLPTETFEGEMTLQVGSREVRLIEAGPAHTRGDTLVYLPAERVIFTGDILFSGAHPVMWVGPVANWIRACDRILALDVETVVPGHGPITDKRGVSAMKGYFEYLTRETRARFDAGMSPMDAARDITFDDYATWGESERIIANVTMLYREFRNERATPTPLELLGQMAAFARNHKQGN